MAILTDNQLQELYQLLADVADPSTTLKICAEVGGTRAALGTSGQLTGVVLVDMAWRAEAKLRMFSIDTLRLFPETYYLFDELYDRYGMRVEWFRPDQQEIRTMISSHGEFLFFDTKAKQEYCCDVRKVHPNQKALETMDVWITGLRRDQSESRGRTERLSWVDHRDSDGMLRRILKVCPLVDWTEAELRDYTKVNDVPVHKLLTWKHNGWSYESLGCMICTTPTGPDEPRRSGRWRWFNSLAHGDNKECGIHLAHLREEGSGK